MTVFPDGSRIVTRTVDCLRCGRSDSVRYLTDDAWEKYLRQSIGSQFPFHVCPVRFPHHKGLDHA
jgi:hypothetical protein